MLGPRIAGSCIPEVAPLGEYDCPLLLACALQAQALAPNISGPLLSWINSPSTVFLQVGADKRSGPDLQALAGLLRFHSSPSDYILATLTCSKVVGVQPWALCHNNMS